MEEQKGNVKEKKEVQEKEELEEAEEKGSQGHSCDKEVRMKDVASVRQGGK